MTNFANYINDNFGTQIAELGTIIGALFTTIRGFFQSFSNENKPVMDAFVTFFQKSWEGMKVIFEATF